MNTFELNKPVKPTGQLADLTEPQRKQLSEWLNSTKTYEEIMGFIEKDFGIRLTSTYPLKDFRKKMYLAQQARPICPPSIPREVWEASLMEMEKVLRDSETKIETRVRVSAFLLQLCRLTLDSKKLRAKPRTQKNPKGADATKPDGANPLDDQEKLDEVRRQVFGSAPNTKPPDPKPDSPKP